MINRGDFWPQFKPFFSLLSILVKTNSQKDALLAIHSYTSTCISLIKYKAVINTFSSQEPAIIYIQLAWSWTEYTRPDTDHWATQALYGSVGGSRSVFATHPLELRVGQLGQFLDGAVRALTAVGTATCKNSKNVQTGKNYRENELIESFIKTSTKDIGHLPMLFYGYFYPNYHYFISLIYNIVKNTDMIRFHEKSSSYTYFPQLVYNNFT